MHLGLEPAAQRDQLAAVAHRLPQTTHVGRGDPRLGQPAHPEQVSKITSVKFVVLHPPVRETLNPQGMRQVHVAWPSPAGDGVYLAGFSHGGAGIGWALMRYAAATGATRYATLAGAAFAHERGLYDPRLGDWRDLRRGTGRPPAAMHAWCNGAPGIGLARADILHRLAPRGALQLAVAGDFDLPVTAALTAGPLSNHSLCHGELGNLELLTAAAALGNAEAAAARAGRTAAALAEIERGDARCGTPGMVGTPGLLTGYAGIGHGLLRLAYPERVPAVLLLDAPSTRSPDAPSTPSLDAPSTGEEQEYGGDPLG